MKLSHLHYYVLKHMHSVEGKENKCQESVAIERKAEKVELQLVSYCQVIIYKF